MIFQVCDYAFAERGTVAFSLAAPRAGSVDEFGKRASPVLVRFCTRKTSILSCFSVRQALNGSLSGDGALPVQN